MSYCQTCVDHEAAMDALRAENAKLRACVEAARLAADGTLEAHDPILRVCSCVLCEALHALDATVEASDPCNHNRETCQCRWNENKPAATATMEAGTNEPLISQQCFKDECAYCRAIGCAHDCHNTTVTNAFMSEACMLCECEHCDVERCECSHHTRLATAPRYDDVFRDGTAALDALDTTVPTEPAKGNGWAWKRLNGELVEPTIVDPTAEGVTSFDGQWVQVDIIESVGGEPAEAKVRACDCCDNPATRADGRCDGCRTGHVNG